MSPPAQAMQALEKANRYRLHRADVKRQIKRGELSIAEALDDPIVTYQPCGSRKNVGMTLEELLGAQERWGRHRVRRFLGFLDLSPKRPLWRLTERQRVLLVEALEHGRTA